MLATRALRQAAASAAHAEHTPMIQFIGKRTIPASVDHTPKAHPASPTLQLPEGFAAAQQKGSSPSFSSYRQTAQQHGPLARSAFNSGMGIGGHSGHSLGPVSPAKGEVFDRNELPQRFRRTRLDVAEIDAIDTGGASLVC